jgi:Tol biopolymer transport system component
VFLAKACPDDDALRRDVESLLNESASDDGFLDGPAIVAAAQLAIDLPSGVMIGRSLGAYHLEALLGAGGMGEVYRAHDAKLGRDVAIKILPRAFTSHPDRLARFEREARMLAALNHPNICAIYGLEESESVRFLVLELVEGETLAHRLASRGDSRGSGLPTSEALTIGRQIVDALEAAHDKGIVHRDLKPANISLTPDGVVKVLDFGLAKAVGGDGSSPDLTHAPDATRTGGREGAVMGTAAYMSPEQARGLPVDKRTDIWAFGCVLYELLTGRVTFAGDTVSDSIAKILEREPDWSALPAATPAPIRRLLLRCLTKDPRKRLRDIGDVRIEIDAIGDVLPGPSDTPVAARRRWRSALGAAVVVLGLLVAVGATWLTWAALAPPSIETRLARARFVPFTNFEGSELDAAISHDGDFVAFLADRDGPFHVWLSRVGTGLFDDLTPRDGDQRNAGLLRSAGFSADGSEVWLSGTGGMNEMPFRKLPLLGGEPRVFLRAHTVNAAWSRDGTRLAYFTYDPGDAFYVADSTGGNERQLLPADNPEVHHHFPAWSMDGRWIYYAQGIHGISEYDVWRIPSSGSGTPERLTHQNSNIRYVTPIDDRTVLYVAPDADRSGPWLWALDVERKVTRRVSIGLERYLSVAASADGRRLVASVGTQTASLWSVPILDRVAEESEVTPYPLPPGRALAPRFGRGVLFYQSSSGTGDGLWRFRDGKTEEIWKGSDGALLESPSVSPSGDWVAVVLMKDRKRRLTIVSADGAINRSLAETIDIRGTSAWSPDAKTILTGGIDAEGPGLFSIPVDGGAPVRLKTGHLIDPAWSPDGMLITYTMGLAASGPLMAMRPNGEAVPLPNIRIPVGGGGRVRFLPDGKSLVYVTNPIASQDFWLLDVTTGKKRQLTRLSSSATLNTFDVTPDGTRIVFDRLRENADIRLIDLPEK